MPCYNPLVAWRVEGKIVFNPPTGSAGLLKPFNLPCSKCYGCRLNYARSWALRCQLEALSHKENCFITLTFSNEYLEKRKNPWSVNKIDFQLFMKKLRKKYGDHIRYFHCGEYGEKTYRPHYHALIFGHDFRIQTNKNKVQKFGKGKFPLYNSEELNNLWSMGHCTVGELNFDTASYTARYVTKKIKGEASKIHINPQTGVVTNIEDVYCTMSRGNKKTKFNGIGEEAYHKYKHRWYGNDFIVNGNGIKMKPPRYFDKLYEQEFPEKFEAIKKARKETLDIIGYSIKDPKYKRLREIEEVKQLKLREQLRELDS
tara:strand:+ start:178 stop:1119 length:942 start_codon:yes stop_codon:yes gene_type:complete